MFVHLHNHTEYSIQDSVNRISDCLERVKEIGQTACAITDHGVMYGVVQFYKKAKELGIKPIIGCEVYLTDKDHRTKEDASYGKYYHLVLLAENETGYKNLSKLCTLGFTEGFYRRPRIDYALLEKYHEGLICLSACIAGELPKAILRGDIDAARRIVKRNVNIFGEGNYFLEIQDHGIQEEKKVTQAIAALSRELGVPMVATNDCHYTRKEDRAAHDAMLCVRANSQHKGEAPVLLNMADSRHIRYAGDGYYIKTEDEMRELFQAFPEAIENTQKIADRCNVELKFHDTKMPSFDVPDGSDAFSYLEKLCTEGLPRKYPGRENEIRVQMEYELKMIQKMGFVDYFLIVWDFVNWARMHDIPVGPGRGSVCGSCVAYLIGITEIDPFKYNLVFERFLNPERVSMPDIDLDFCVEKRSRVVDYVKKKYGDDCVCQIITFGTFAAKQAIKDIGKCMGLTISERDALAKLIPEELGMTLKKAREISREFDTACRKHEDVFQIACALEGLPRQTSTHAAGIIICDRPVSEYIPLSVKDGTVQSQFDMVEVEELGLLKMDFLGLRTLTAISTAKESIMERHGKIPEMREDDPEVFQLISKGRSTGVFQLESQGMQDFMKELKPTCMDDLIAGIALYRPGPMDFIPAFIMGKHGNVSYKCPELKPILESTYGCIVYQEQVMQIFRDLAGYPLGRADIVRRAMSKKKASVLDAERDVFLYGDGTIPGCVRNGIPEEIAKEIFASMEEFSKYAFNKSHAAAYAVVCYTTAWLMRYYPTEYFAALMTSVIQNKEKVADYAQAARTTGIVLKPVDINRSGTVFTPSEDNEILFGLGGIANIGQAAAEEFCKRRGIITTFRGAIETCKEVGISSQGVASLANAGAFSTFGGNRKQYAMIAKDAMSMCTKQKKKQVIGQMDLFSLMGEQPPELALPDVKEYPYLEKCEKEKEACGMYVSCAPMEGFKSFAGLLSGLQMGMVRKEKRYESRTGTMAFITMEMHGGKEREFVVFPNVFTENRGNFLEGNILLFRCKQENVITQVVEIHGYPVNVYIRTTQDNLIKTCFACRELIEREGTEESGMDELRVYSADKNRVLEKKRVAGGYFKEESFLNALRTQFGKDNVILRPVKK